MAEIKIKGDISGSTTIKAPDSGSDEVIELSTVLDGKAPLDSPTFTGTPALPDGTTLAGSALTSGKILQVVRATDTTNRSTTSTSYVDVPGMTVTITPSDAANAILLVVTGFINAAGGQQLRGQITDSSNNTISGCENFYHGCSGSLFGYLNAWAYATPATTSAVTYKFRWRSSSGGTMNMYNGDNTGQMFAMEVQT